MPILITRLRQTVPYYYFISSYDLPYWERGISFKKIRLMGYKEGFYIAEDIKSLLLFILGLCGRQVLSLCGFTNELYICIALLTLYVIIISVFNTFHTTRGGERA